MIDSHAHVVPDLVFQARRLAPSAAAPVNKWLKPLIDSAVELLTPVPTDRSPQPPLNVERTASLRKRWPSPFMRALESTATLAAVPTILAGFGTPEKLLASMSRNGIERTVVIAGPPITPNDWVLEDLVDIAGDAVIPVTMPPSLDRETATESEWIAGYCDHADRGARGFRIHNNMQGLLPTHPAYRAMFQVAQQRGLFIILHTGWFHVFSYKNKQATTPDEFESLFREFPAVRVCLAHMNRDDPDQAWAMMKRYEQLYTDTSWQPSEAIRRAIEIVGSDRILLGSDWPLLHNELQGEAIDILKRAVSDADFEKITRCNAIRFVGDN